MKFFTYTMPRSFGGFSIPISIQSCYMRNYCNNNGWEYSLPETELCVKGSFKALWSHLKKNKNDDTHILVCSLFVFDGLDNESQEFKDEIKLERNVYIYSALENTILLLEEAIQYIRDANEIRKIQSLNI